MQWGHHLAYASLAESAAEGCYVCQAAWGRLSGFEQEFLCTTEIKQRHEQESNSSTNGSLVEYVTYAELSLHVFPEKLAFIIRFNEAMSPEFPEVPQKHSLFLLGKEAGMYLTQLYTHTG
jgi:hypothetical protein